MRALVLDAQWDPRPDYVVSEWEKQTGKAVTGSSIWRHPTLHVGDWPDPQPGPQEVVLAVQACGVCGSDMHFYETDKEHYILYPGLTKFPTILGHEFTGKVVACGSQVSTLKVGDMVTAEEMIWCGRCIPCRNGYPNQCENLEEIGFTIPGAFAKYIAVDEKFCWKIDAIAERLGSEEAAYELGALTEPTTVSYNAMFERAHGFRPGQYVAVFGAGSIGLAATGLARAGGAGIVAVFDVSSSRLELAKKVGADYVFNSREVNPAEALLQLSKGAGFDFFVEAAGVPQATVPEMEKALAIDAKIVQIGRAAAKVPMYLERFQVRHSQFFGSQGHSGNATFPNVIRLVASGKLDLRPIITAKYELEQTVDAIALMSKREGGKVLVKPNM